jgi:hypothetical protein
MPLKGIMGIVRTISPFVFLGAALLVARPAASGPSSTTDHIVAGDVSKRGPMLVAGAHGVTYELKGGAIVQFDAGAEFAFQPSLKLKLRKPNDPETLTRALRVAKASSR